MFKSLITRLFGYTVVAKPMGSLPVKVHYRKEPPPRTEKMIGDGFVWAETPTGWTEVCLTCGGNCGQCGTSLGMGNPPSMDAIMESTGIKPR